MNVMYFWVFVRICIYLLKEFIYNIGFKRKELFVMYLEL